MMMGIANRIMLAIFLFSAALQYNDPDPWIWMFYYVTAAAVTLLAIRKRPTWLAGVAAIAFYAGFAYCMPGWDLDSILLLRDPKMSSIEVELAREAFGLLICAVWMSVLTFMWYRGKGKEDAGHQEEEQGTPSE